MNTSAKDITLSPGINESELSPECMSTLIDLWPTLSTTAVEAVQALDCNMFSFAESCFFFGVILKNKEEKKQEGTSSDRVEEGQSRWEAEEARAASRSAVLETNRRSLDSLSARVDAPSSSAIADAWRQANALNDDLHNAPYQINNDSDDTFEKLWREISQNPRTTTLPSPDRFNAVPTKYEPVEVPWDEPVGTGVFQPTQPLVTAFHDRFPPPHKKAIGVVYLTTSPHETTLTNSGSNIGVVLIPDAQGKGYARQAIELVLDWGFQEIGFHRVQAVILDTPSKAQASALFTQMGFVHEGVRRRSVYVQNEGITGGEWRDATCLALLETEWFMRSYFKPAPKNLWDEMFARHSREREELLRWDERQNGIKRTSSTETIRLFGIATSETASAANESDASSVISAESSVRSGKRRKIENDPFEDQSRASSPPPSDSESISSWASGGVRLPHSPFSHIPRGSATAVPRDDGANLQSESSASFSQHTSPPNSVPREGSPADSQWDMLSTSDSSASEHLSLDSGGFTSEED